MDCEKEGDNRNNCIKSRHQITLLRATVLHVLTDGVNDKANARKRGANYAGVNFTATVDMVNYAGVRVVSTI